MNEWQYGDLNALVFRPAIVIYINTFLRVSVSDLQSNSDHFTNVQSENPPDFILADSSRGLCLAQQKCVWIG